MDAVHSEASWPWMTVGGAPRLIMGYQVYSSVDTERHREVFRSQVGLLKQHGIEDVRDGLDAGPSSDPSCINLEAHRTYASEGLPFTLTVAAWHRDARECGGVSIYPEWFEQAVPFRGTRPYFLHPAFRESYGRLLSWYARQSLPVVAVEFFNEPVIDYTVDDTLTRASFDEYLCARYGSVPQYNAEHGTDHQAWADVAGDEGSYDCYMWRSELVPHLCRWARDLYAQSAGQSVPFGINLCLLSGGGSDPAQVALKTDILMYDLYTDDVAEAAMTAKVLRGCCGRQRPVMLHEVGGQECFPWSDVDLERKIVWIQVGSGITSMYLWHPAYVGMPSLPLILHAGEETAGAEVLRAWGLKTELNARANPWLTEYGRIRAELYSIMPVLGTMRPVDPDIALVFSQHTQALGQSHLLDRVDGETVGRRRVALELSAQLADRQVQHDITSDINIEEDLMPPTRSYLWMGRCLSPKSLKRLHDLVDAGYRIYGIREMEYTDLAGRAVSPPFTDWLTGGQLDALATELARSVADSRWRELEVLTQDGRVASGIEVLPWTDGGSKRLVFLVNVVDRVRDLVLRVSPQVREMRLYRREAGWQALCPDDSGSAKIQIHTVALVDMSLA